MRPTCLTLTAATLGLASLLIAGCPNVTVIQSDGSSSGTIQGSGHVVTEKRTVDTFSRIEMDGAADIQTTIGPAQPIEVTLDDNLLPIITTKVENGTLHITSSKSYSSSSGLKVKIVTPALSSVTASGAATLQAAGLNAPAFSLDFSGAATAQLAGQVDAVEVRLSGAGKIHANDLSAKKVKLDISGAGQAEVCATQSLDVTLSGAGSVRYRGQPAEVHKSVSGAGFISPE